MKPVVPFPIGARFVGAICFAIACELLAFSQDDQFAKQYENAQRALLQGKYAEAEGAFEHLRDVQPNTAEIHANLGLIYFEEKKFTQAIPELRRAVQLKPSLSKSEFLVAMSLSEIGHYAEAVPGLEKGFRSSDREMKRMCGLQLERAYSALGQDRKSVETALEMSRLYPKEDVHVHFCRAGLAPPGA